jgi:hypothetical protein
MRTLIIYTNTDTQPEYLVVDGDYSRFNGVMVNSINGTGYEDEFIEWMYDNETGERKLTGWSEDVAVIEGKQWDKVILCTFIF